MISYVAAEDAATCLSCVSSMPRAPSGPRPPSPATVIRASFNDRRRLSERLSTDTEALTRAHLPLKIAHDQLIASGRARSFGRGQIALAQSCPVRVNSAVSASFLRSMLRLSR